MRLANITMTETFTTCTFESKERKQTITVSAVYITSRETSKSQSKLAIDSCPAAFVLAHGSSGNLKNLLPTARKLVAASSFPCCLFNFFYREQGKRFPSKMENNTEDLRFVSQSFCDHCETHFKLRISSLILGGRSYGCRVSCHLFNSLAHNPLKVENSEGLREVKARGLLFLAYPLHPPSKTTNLRDGPLRGLSEDAHCLFVTGERDALCTLSILRSILADLQCQNCELFILPTADHSLKVRVKENRLSQAQAEQKVIDQVILWMCSALHLSPVPVKQPLVTSQTTEQQSDSVAITTDYFKRAAPGRGTASSASKRRRTQRYAT